MDGAHHGGPLYGGPQGGGSQPLSSSHDGEVTDPAFTRALLESLHSATRMSNSLPASDAHFATSFPGMQGNLTGLGNRLTGMMQGFVDQHGGPSHGHAGGGLPPSSTDDVADHFDTVVDLTGARHRATSGGAAGCARRIASPHAAPSPSPRSPPARVLSQTEC